MLPMADRKSIITLPHKSLRKPSRKVGVITKDIKKIIKDMKDATLDWEDHRNHEFGVALAGVQINHHYNIVIVRSNLDNKADRTFQVFINPVITKKEGEPVYDHEGCLSILDIYGKIPRYPKVKVKALDEDGREFRVTAEDFVARVFQHEIDHTKGKLFIDLIEDEDSFYKINEDGKLIKQEYDEIKDNKDLWG